MNLFLVLSGFCLYWPLACSPNRKLSLADFARKRCRRILPPYYAVLIVYGGLAGLQAWRHHDRTALAYVAHWLIFHALMLHNLRSDYVLALDAPLWSLALEFQLYILFPMIVAALQRLPAVGVVGAALASDAAYRLFLSHGGYLTDLGTGYVMAYSVFGRWFEFVLGMYLAKQTARWYAEQRMPFTPLEVALAICGLAVTAVFCRHSTQGTGDFWFQPFVDILFGLIFAFLIVFTTRQQSVINQLFSLRWLVFLGTISYSVYLVHQPLVLVLEQYALAHHFAGGAQALWSLLMVVPTVLAVGYGFHLCFEKPFLSSTGRIRAAR